MGLVAMDGTRIEEDANMAVTEDVRLEYLQISDEDAPQLSNGNGDSVSERTGGHAGSLTGAVALEEDADMASPEIEEDLRLGYLQISDEASSHLPTVDDKEATASSSPLGNGNHVGQQNGGIHGVSLAGAVISSGRNSMERVVTVNGMEFHVYGNVSGLELLGGNAVSQEENEDIAESEGEEEGAAVERAIAEANAADLARRAAPIPPDRRARIMDAMKGINLGGFRPAWADFVSENQWMSKIKGISNSAPK